MTFNDGSECLGPKYPAALPLEPVIILSYEARHGWLPLPLCSDHS